MPYNGLLFSGLLQWAAPCVGDPPSVMFLADKFRGQYIGSKEVPRETQTRILLSDAERTVVKKAKDCVSGACVQIGTIKSWMVDETLRLREEQEAASGRTITRIPTGRIFAEGSRSEAHEMTVWSCPSSVEGVPAGPGVVPAGTYAPPASAFPIAPVVGGLAAAGLVAFLLLR